MLVRSRRSWAVGALLVTFLALFAQTASTAESPRDLVRKLSDA